MINEMAKKISNFYIEVIQGLLALFAVEIQIITWTRTNTFTQLS